MTTATASGDVRDQAIAILAAHLGGTVDLTKTVDSLEAAGVVDALHDLETRFNILLDVDEAYSGTTADLLLLVQRRAYGLQMPPPRGSSREGGEGVSARTAHIYAWDDYRAARGLPLYVPRPRLFSVSPSLDRPACGGPDPLGPVPEPAADPLPEVPAARPATPSAAASTPAAEARAFPPQLHNAYPFHIPAAPEPWLYTPPLFPAPSLDQLSRDRRMARRARERFGALRATAAIALTGTILATGLLTGLAAIAQALGA